MDLSILSTISVNEPTIEQYVIEYNDGCLWHTLQGAPTIYAECDKEAVSDALDVLKGYPKGNYCLRRIASRTTETKGIRL